MRGGPTFSIVVIFLGLTAVAVASSADVRRFFGGARAGGRGGGGWAEVGSGFEALGAGGGGMEAEESRPDAGDGSTFAAGFEVASETVDVLAR